MLSYKRIQRLNSISEGIEHFTDKVGQYIAWLVLIMVILVSYDVTMRYFYQSGSVALQELEWHLFSLIFLLGTAYTFKHDDHVRLDLFYQSKYMNEYRRAWVNFLGGVLFLIPFCLLIIITSWPFVAQSYLHMEGSPDPGGLAYRWILKSSIPLGFALLLLQGMAEIIKNLLFIMDEHR